MTHARTTQSANLHQSSGTLVYVLGNTSVKSERSAAVMVEHIEMRKRYSKNLVLDKLLLKWHTKVFVVSYTSDTGDGLSLRS